MGSVRWRITIVSAVLVAGVLTVAGVALLRAVEVDLEGRAQLALEEAEFGGDAFSTLMIGDEEYTLDMFAPDEDDDEIFGELAGPDGAVIYTLAIEPESAELIEIIDDEGRFVRDGIIYNVLQESIFNVEVIDDDTFLVVADELEDVRESLDAIRDALWFAVPILTGLFSLLTYLLVGRALRPVHAITAEVESISANELDRRVPVPDGTDEVSELATVMNSMLDRVESGAKRQREFSADASHELRSPLTSIRAAAEMISRKPTGDRVESMADDVVAEADRMNDLIDDLLALARADEATLAHPESISLTTIAAEIATATSERAHGPDGSHSSVALRAEGPEVIVAGDGDQLRRLVQNLVDNAVRHAASSVVVSVAEGAGGGTGAVLCVEDDGPGIPAEARSTVFDRFTRLDDARSRTAGGAGLGLALVAAIVRRHGAAIDIDMSPTLGGARFTVTFPTD